MSYVLLQYGFQMIINIYLFLFIYSYLFIYFL